MVFGKIQFTVCLCKYVICTTLIDIKLAVAHGLMHHPMKACIDNKCNATYILELHAKVSCQIRASVASLRGNIHLYP